jgi:hypothetical protein
MQYDTMVMFNMTEAPIKTEHVAWNVTKELDNKYRLYEIVRVTYRHPDAKDLATVVNLEERLRGEVDATQAASAPYVLMYHAQINIAASH